MLTDEVRERSSGSAIEAALKFVKTETGSVRITHSTGTRLSFLLVGWGLS